MPLKPHNFDGEKFAKKYNLDPFGDFYDDGKGNIICPSLPNLTDTDLLDCLLDPPRSVKTTAEEAIAEVKKTENMEIQNLLVVIEGLEKRLKGLENKK